MPNRCVAFGCKSGYKKQTDNNGPKITFHSFPTDKELIAKWNKANPRKDFEPSKHSRLCSLHFRPTDFVDVSNDSNGTRKKLHPGKQLSLRYLKKDAVPSIFPNAPSYLSSTGTTPRTTRRATSSSRREREAEELQLLSESFFTADDITLLTVENIEQRLNSEPTVPSGFRTIIIHDALHIYMIGVKDETPAVVACLTIRRNLTVSATSHGALIPESQYRDIVDGSVTTMSQLVNLLAHLKSWTDGP